MSSSGLLMTTSTVLGVTLRPGLTGRLDATAGQRRDVADVFGFEGSRRVDVARHVAALHCVEPERTALDRRRGGLQSAGECRYGDDAQD